MKNTLRLIAAFFALLLVSTQIPNAQASGLDKERTFAGFAFERSVMPQRMKNTISRWVMSNPGYNMISCTGYTGHNVKNRTQEFLQDLAERRARAVCEFINGKYQAITIYSTQGIKGDGKTADARKVTVRLLSVTNTGGGSGGAVIGTCDTSVNISMRSRWVGGRFLFGSMTIKNISTNCRGKVLDVYLIDANGDQITMSADNAVSNSSVTVGFVEFDNTAVRSDQINQIAIEFRDP